MNPPPVYIVHLRRPILSNPDEQRSDPFYECGSFGCTGCHSRNLMHPKNIRKIRGARLAFVQGGQKGFRLVFLTPPVTPRLFDDRVEARWSPPIMPFRYPHAPILASNNCRGDFPSIESMAAKTGRSTIEGGFSSLFRSRSTPLHHAAAIELIKIYEKMRSKAATDAIARKYYEALPYPPPSIDKQRKITYRNLLRNLGAITTMPRCHPSTLSNLPPKRSTRCRP